MELPKEVLVGLVGAVAALVVAGIGLLSAVRAARENRETQIELENIKRSFADDVLRSSRRAAFVQKEMEHISKDIDVLQAVRDELRRFLDAPVGITKIENLMSSLYADSDAVEKQYREHYSSNPSEYVKLMHTAKSDVIGVLGILANRTQGIQYASDLGDETQREIRYARSQLQSIQERLRNEYLRSMKEYMDPSK